MTVERRLLGVRGARRSKTPSPSVYRKYNSLIQTQARELSHLRQRMREGQRVCHILTQNMGDTTKVRQTYYSPRCSCQGVISFFFPFLSNPSQAFEELLRANDIDYYMGQSFREQLAQNIALAQRVVTKISGREERLLKALPALTSRASPPTCFCFRANRRLRRESRRQDGPRAAGSAVSPVL